MKKLILAACAISLLSGCVKFKSPSGYEAELDTRKGEEKVSYKDPAGNVLEIDTNPAE